MRAESYARLTAPELVPTMLRFRQITFLAGVQAWNPAGPKQYFSICGRLGVYGSKSVPLGATVSISGTLWPLPDHHQRYGHFPTQWIPANRY